MEQFGGFALQFSSLNSQYFIEKILITSIMIAIGILATITSILAIVLIEKSFINEKRWKEKIKVIFFNKK